MTGIDPKRTFEGANTPIMALKKPFKRTVRLLDNGSYKDCGHWRYLLHPKFAKDPQHYIRSYLLIQEDLLSLFKSVEPCCQNRSTVSLRIQELLIRVCVEIEANFTAILMENTYTNIKPKKWNIQNAYCYIEFSHKLSSYEVKFPIWKGENNSFTPFENWAKYPAQDWHSLDWYQAYNKSKHDRHKYFEKATFETLLNAVAGLVVILTAQFMDEEYSPNSKSLSISGDYSYEYDPNMETAIGGYLRVKYPQNWWNDEKYDFDWETLKNTNDPFESISYDTIKFIHS